jgi:hypothetical protein
MITAARQEQQLGGIAVEAAAPGVSWASVVAGAFIIAGVALILMALGTGFGLASVSLEPQTGMTAGKIAVATGVWLIVVQWLSSAIGGYVAGRLRTRWSSLHVDESYFRDVAHGILAWSVAAVVIAALVVWAASSIAGGAVRGATTVGAAATEGAAQGSARNPAAPSGYLVDTLFRPDHPDANANSQDVRAETTRILAADLRSGDVPAGDKSYLASLVAARTGLSQPDAQKRVDDVVAKAQAAEQKLRAEAEAARRAARNLAFFAGFSMLVGAFMAGVAAKIGGHRRDEMIV